MLSIEKEKQRLDNSDAETRVLKSICSLDHETCGVLVHVSDGRVVKIEGDPSHPQNEGAMCPKGLSYIHTLYHPERITHPMKRAGERGEGKWQRISWDEALDTIASKIRQAKEEYGPESIALSWCDGLRGNELAAFGLMHAIGSPMICGTDAQYCFRPQANADMATFGMGNFITSEKSQGGPEFEHSKCMFMWGANPFHCHMTMGRNIIKGLKNGAKLIVVDPRFTNLAAKADLWLQVRPATDGALALGMLNFIIAEGLYDREFVDKYCSGFDRLKERAKEYPPKKVSEITWVPEEDIRQAATMYATLKPAAVSTRMGINMHTNAIQSLRAIDLLIALTGNIDVKGGNVLAIPDSDLPYVPWWKIELATRLSEQEMEKAPGVKDWPMFYGHNACIFAKSHPHSFFDMLLTGKPYKTRVLLCVNDPVMGLQDSKKIREAIKNVDFVVKNDLFISPTANLADILLPVASYLEKDEIHNMFYTGFFAVAGKVIEPVGECRDEKEIFIELARKLDVEFPFPMKSVREFLDYQLEPSGMTFEEAKKKRIIEIPFHYKKYEKEGFKFPTGTGKIELYSRRFEEYGYDPLPYYEEPPVSPYSTPELWEQYPLILISGARTNQFYHSMGRQISWLRELFPEPAIEIHPDTAEKLGICEGDWVWIETSQKEGRIKQKAELTSGIHPRVVHARSHWWFPERKDDPERGCMESNINAIMSDGPPYDPISGSTIVRGCLCKIYKVEND